MTRRSIREIERTVEALEDESGEGDGLTVEITETIIRTGWSRDDQNEDHDTDGDGLDQGDVVSVETVEFET